MVILVILIYGISLKCYDDEKMLFSFSVDSDFMFGKNAPCPIIAAQFQKQL